MPDVSLFVRIIKHVLGITWYRSWYIKKGLFKFWSVYCKTAKFIFPANLCGKTVGQQTPHQFAYLSQSYITYISVFIVCLSPISSKAPSQKMSVLPVLFALQFPDTFSFLLKSLACLHDFSFYTGKWRIKWTMLIKISRILRERTKNKCYVMWINYFLVLSWVLLRWIFLNAN